MIQINKIIINPITRISGFLQVNASIENSTVIDASISGNLFRGFEKMVEGKNPEDIMYYTQRICGICSSAHSIASARAVENISKTAISENAGYIRGIIHGFDILQNHLRQFYIFTIPDFIPIQGTDININSKIPDDKIKSMTKNYYKAVEISMMAHEGLSIFGGKAPHNHGIVFGGVTQNVSPFDIGKCGDILKVISDFVNKNVQEDLSIIEQYYGIELSRDDGIRNFLSFGLYNEYPEVKISDDLYIMDNNRGIPEYKDMVEDDTNFYNPECSIYNFIKAPRMFGEPFECGPLARGVIRGDFSYSSTMCRIKARCYEMILVVKALEYFVKRINTGINRPAGTITDGKAAGMTDTMRGALLHYAEISNSKITRYDIITPSMWNLSPEDKNGKIGPLEKSLIGTYVEDENNPQEIMRVVHSYDPCVSCATHVMNIKGEEIGEINHMPL